MMMDRKTEGRKRFQAREDIIVQQLAQRMALASYFRAGKNSMLHGWNPALRSADEAVRASWRTAAARAIDTIHNSGLIAGAIDQVCIDTIGSELRLSSTPDAEVLGWEPKERMKWCSQVEKRWNEWSNDPNECDMRGRMTVGEMTEQALRWHMSFGVHTTLFYRDDVEGSESKLKVYMVSPYKLSTETDEANNLKQGVYVNEFGRALGYRFLKKNSRYSNDHINYKAFDKFGRRQVLHIYLGDAHSARGISPLAPVLKTIKHFLEHVDATSATAIMQTMMAATIKSPQFSDDALHAFKSNKPDLKTFLDNEGNEDVFGDMTPYMDAMINWSKNSAIDFSEYGKIVHLFPGEELELNTPNAPGNNFKDFNQSLLREISRCIGVTYSSLSNDHTSATYSSVRMENATIWPLALQRRKRVAAPLVSNIFFQWLEEEIAYGRIEFPGGYSRFLKQRRAASKHKLHGPAKPTADDKKSSDAQGKRLENGTSSVTMECAEAGIDFETMMEEKVREKEIYEQNGWVYPYGSPKALESKPQSDAEVEAA